MMLKRTLFPSSILTLLLLLTGCGEGPLLPESSGEKVLLQFPSGGFYSRESIIPLKVMERSRGASGSSWTDFEARLTSSTGRTLRTWRGLYSEGPDFSLEIPQDLEGIRQGDFLELNVSVFDRKLLLSEGRMNFFLVDDLPVISGTTHPMSVYPGSRVLLDLLDQEPWKGKTWVRWSWDKKVIHEGPWASSAQFRWDTPRDKAGAYALKAEVFPQAPARGTFSFPSPLVLDFPVAASLEEGDNYGPKELKPDGSYYYLYHFRGNLRDTGTSGDPSLLPEWNGLDIGLSQGVFGVRFRSETGLTRAGAPVPLDAQGRIQAFSVTITGVLDKEPEGLVYRIGTEEEGLSLRLALEKGQWVLDYALGTWKGSFRKNYDPLEVFSQTLSYIPSETGAEILWFHGPDLEGFSQVSWKEPPVIKSPGTVQLGGPKGFQGILDEFGLYYRDGTDRPSADGRLLEKHLKSTETGNLLWAAGFDGSFLDEGFSASGNMRRSRGQAVLPPSEWLETPPLEDVPGGFLLTVPGNVKGNFRISLVDEQGEETAELFRSAQWQASRDKESQDPFFGTVLFDDVPSGDHPDGLVQLIKRPEYSFRLRLTADTGAESVLDYIICEKILPPAEEPSLQP